MVLWRALVGAIVITSVAHAEDAGLRLRFRAGETQDYRMTQDAKLELKVAGGGKVATEVKREFDFRWNVQAVDPNGTATIAIDVTAVKLHVTGPGGQTADFDSTSESDPHGFAASLSPLFQAILNAELVAKLSARGELIDFQVPEELKTVLNSKPAGKAVGQLGAVADLESLARLGMPALPAAADFAQGGEWQEKRTLQEAALGPLVIETTYRWDSTRDVDGQQVARIVPATTFGFPEPEAGKPAISSEEALTAESEILFNLTAGRLESVVYHDAITLSSENASDPTSGTLRHTLTVARIENEN